MNIKNKIFFSFNLVIFLEKDGNYTMKTYAYDLLLILG